MNLDTLQAAISKSIPDDFKRVLRKEETVSVLKGNFAPGRAPYIHQAVFPNGSKVSLKFYNTVKEILNSKGKPVYGKESFLSYVEVTVAPVDQKAYCFSVDVKQIVWGTSKSRAQAAHTVNIDELTQFGADLGIDLSAPASWATVYTQNY